MIHKYDDTEDSMPKINEILELLNISIRITAMLGVALEYGFCCRFYLENSSSRKLELDLLFPSARLHSTRLA